VTAAAQLAAPSGSATIVFSNSAVPVAGTLAPLLGVSDMTMLTTMVELLTARGLVSTFAIRPPLADWPPPP
jgi:hypothetical protein